MSRVSKPVMEASNIASHAPEPSETETETVCGHHQVVQTQVLHLGQAWGKGWVNELVIVVNQLVTLGNRLETVANRLERWASRLGCPSVGRLGRWASRLGMWENRLWAQGVLQTWGSRKRYV